MSQMTSFEDRCEIITSFQAFYEDDERFNDFIAIHNIGIPLAIALTDNLITGLTDDGKKWIDITFDDLLALLGIVDTGWETLYQIEQSVGLYPIIKE